MDDSGAQRPYRRVDSLEWSEQELELGKLVKVKGFPGDYKLKLLRVVVNTHRTEWIVTNDLPRDSARAAQKARRLRWKIEELYRESKQLSGIERCQWSQRAHPTQPHRLLSLCVLVWSRLKQLAHQSGQTVYRIKRALLHDYLVQQLKNPSVQMVLA